MAAALDIADRTVIAEAGRRMTAEGSERLENPGASAVA